VGIGASIFLIALGAILAFAVHVDLGGVDISVIGWILMLAGVLGLITFVMVWGRRRTVVSPPVEERRHVAEEPVEYRRVEERRRDVGPPL
jgi:Na+/proline symporter